MTEASLTWDEINIGDHVEIVNSHIQLVTSRGEIIKKFIDDDGKKKLVLKDNDFEAERHATDAGLTPYGTTGQLSATNRTYWRGKGPIQTRDVTVNGETQTISIPKGKEWMSTDGLIGMGLIDSIPPRTPRRVPEGVNPNVLRLLGF